MERVQSPKSSLVGPAITNILIAALIVAVKSKVNTAIIVESVLKVELFALASPYKGKNLENIEQTLNACNNFLSIIALVLTVSSIVYVVRSSKRLIPIASFVASLICLALTLVPRA